jgi:hypothetical protein
MRSYSAGEGVMKGDFAHQPAARACDPRVCRELAYPGRKSITPPSYRRAGLDVLVNHWTRQC